MLPVVMFCVQKTIKALKAARTILLRILLFVMSLQILNLSVRVDNGYDDTDPPTCMTESEDLDSFKEKQQEKITDYNGYDSHTPLIIQSGWTAGLDISNKLCEGYFEIISPPPNLDFIRFT